jgi:hypothetical protein
MAQVVNSSISGALSKTASAPALAGGAERSKSHPKSQKLAQ